MSKPNIWFLLPPCDSPSGGINLCYRFCELAEDLGISAGVISERPYRFCDPETNHKYWHEITRKGTYLDQFDIDAVQQGDLVVQAELYPFRFQFSKPVRRIIFVQNWALIHPWAGWQEHIWTYDSWTHLTFAIESFAYNNFIAKDPMPDWRPADWTDTIKMMQKKKLKWSAINPYFDFERHQPGDNDPNKILFLPRKMGNHLDKFQMEFGDKLVIVDGLTPEELRKVYTQVGIILLPSPNEGLCFPAIEALLSGCSVVSWDCGGPEDYLINGETAMVSGFGDFDALMKNVKYLLDNPNEQKRLSANGRELVKKIFNREASKTQLYLAYHSSIKIQPN